VPELTIPGPKVAGKNRLAVAVVDGLVRIFFEVEGELNWMDLQPEDALKVAQALEEGARVAQAAS